MDDVPDLNPTASAATGATSGARNMMVSLAGDVGVPIAAYGVAQLCGLSAYQSLLAGTIVAGIWIAWVAVRDRRLDVFAAFLLVLFGVGLVLTLISGDVRFVLAKDATTSATAGLVMLGSCLVRRPLAYYAAKRFAGAAERDEFLATADTLTMRRRWYTVSMVWGFGLVTDAALRITAAYTLSPNAAADVAQVLTIGTYALLIGYTIRTGRRNAPTASAGSISPSVDGGSVRNGGRDAPLRLLVVDADIRVRAAIRQTMALEADLAIVGECGDATRALAIAETTHPRVALIDGGLLATPAGITLANGLSGHLQCSMVALSMDGGPRSGALAAGAVAFVEKGGDIDAILHAVRTAGTLT